MIPPPLRLGILECLRQDILCCRLPPGVELREGELAERFGVSKSPVRDALSQLIHEGFVIVRPRHGYRVAPISMKDVRDMFQYRGILEAACARLATQLATIEQLKALNVFRSFDSSAYPDGFIGYNRNFHTALSSLSGNNRLYSAISAQMDQMDRLVRISFNAMRTRDPEKIVTQHVEIINALQKRNARRASMLATRHVHEAERRVSRALSSISIGD